MDFRNYLTHNEAAARKEMSPELFRFYIKTDRGPEPELFKGRLYYTKDVMDNWEPEKKTAKKQRKNDRKTS